MIQDIIVISIVAIIIVTSIYKGVKSYRNRGKKDGGCNCSGGGCH